ncbi:hypothetical protein FQZ97_836880 [compost metagenome]
MAHVGIQRFGAGQRQHHGAENRHADARVGDEKIYRPDRIGRPQHFRLLPDAIRPEPRKGQEPQHHHRSEQLADPLGTVLLDQEQADQHHQRHRHHPVLDAVEGDLQPLHRRQHGNRRGDHAVAVEQRRTDQAEDHQHRAQLRMRQRRAQRQGGQRHHPALALVVGTQDEEHVLQRHHPEQRPEDQRQHAEHAVMVDRHAIAADEHLLQGVQRAGTDIAIHHPDRGDQQADGRAGMAGVLVGIPCGSFGHERGIPLASAAHPAPARSTRRGAKTWPESI